MRKRKIRYIGNTDVMEISFPPYPKFNIYADTETFTLLPESSKPGEEPDNKKRKAILQTLVQVPGILFYTHRIIKKDGTRYKINGDGIYNHTFVTENNFEPFFELLQTIYLKRHIPVIYFHNASYDLTCIFPIGQKLDPDLKIYFYTKPGDYSFMEGAIESPKYRFKAEFGDTMLYLNRISIGQMGEELGIPKGQDVPYNMANVNIDDDIIYYIDLIDGQSKAFSLDKYIEYAERDVEIMRKYDEYLHKVKQSVGRTVITDEEEFNNARIYTKTQASHAKSLCNAYLMRSEYETTIDESFRYRIDKESYEYISLSNMGGFTSYNKTIAMYRCNPDEEIRYLDMNSMYPYVMAAGIPGKPLMDTPPSDIPYVTGHLISVSEIEGIPLMEFNVTRPIPLEKISAPDSEQPLKFYVTDEYLQMMKEYTASLNMKLYHTKYQEKTHCLKQFVEDLYTKRISLNKELKELRSKPLTQESVVRIEQLKNQQTGVKIVLNSLYGKFCEKSHHVQCFYSNLSDYQYVRYPVDNPVYRSILSGAYITCTARLLLINHIIECSKQGGKVLYADTDSVIFVCPKTADHSKVFGTDQGWLGQWKEEGRFNIFVNSGVKKKYFLMDANNPANYRKAMSGINKEFVNALTKQLDKGNKQTIEDIIFIFDPANNVILRKMKKNKTRTRLYNQTIIYESDYTFNGKKKINGEVKVENGEYRLIKYGVQN